ncbi:MAG TPA: serine hydrolase domain-containing protein [Woeseiaceae bacterium]|nr:serine hydrolase domain-containing protein [Woeseiaceae bacterium]
MLHYGVPGVSVAVFEDGKIKWAKGYGTARSNGNVPVTETTLFQAASISKSVTAIGVLRLVQDGAIDLDQDVNSYLTSWRVPSSAFTKNRDVTLRGLLNHTAGITVHGFPGYAQDAPVPTLVEVLNGEEPANTERIEVDTPIGETWRYSGGGYTIIQQLLIDVSRQSFQQYMAENILYPLGMTSSTFELRLDELQEAGIAWGYRPGLCPVVSGYHIYPESAAAGLWTTATDIALFAIGVHESAVGSPNSVINKALANEMLASQKGNYGFGVMVSGEGRSHRFRHTGINQGFDSMYVAYSELGTGAVVMTNSNLSSGLIREIIDSVAREYDWPDYPIREQRVSSPFSEDQLENLPGTYEIEEGFDVSVIREGVSFPVNDTIQK